MYIDNLAIWNSYIYNFWSGVYSGFGIGLATDCIFVFTNLYMGDEVDDGVNPLISFNFD